MMFAKSNFTSKNMLFATATSALALSISFTLVSQAQAQTCDLVDGTLPLGCELPNAGDVVVMPAGENTELDTGVSDIGGEGFLISIDGAPVAGDPRVEDLVRRTDIALSKADVQVKFDGLGARPRLDLEQVGETRGGVATFQSHLNYPAYVVRGELRVIDLAAPGGARTVATVPIEPNGQAALPLPEGDNLAVVHRVYDARGRYDETAPLSLTHTDTRNRIDDVEEGTDNTARRRIPVSGGAVTVYGTGVRPGARVTTLGETIRPDPDGSFVLQRIMPAGDQNVSVQINGAGENVFLQREIRIPKSEWFYFTTADLTLGRRFPEALPAENYTSGRLAFYAKGKTANGWTITGSADTREKPLDELFRDFDEKDPYHLLQRLDSDKAYPVYGDDSTLEEDAPTSGKVYLRAEKNGSHLMWGNYKGRVSGSEYLRNERTLYGFEGFYTSPQQTPRGDARFEATVYAAQPDNLPGRDVFRGTGGSVYFLQRQDISVGSETITVEIRDAVTGRVVDRQTLVYGRDYDINYMQGLVTLSAPLTGATGQGTVITDPGGENDVNLVVQYEFTPTAADLDGFSYGGRAEAWVTDNLRFGATGLVEQTDVADQTAVGADLRYEISENTFAEIEYARTSGPGFGSSFSSDGGLIITNSGTPGGGNGEAYLARGQVDLRELGSAVDGTIAGYFERRTAGFSTLDYDVTADETLWGVSAELRPSERLSYRLYYDSFEDSTGKTDVEGGAEVTFRSNERLTWDLGVEHVDRAAPADPDPTKTGSRTDAAIRLTVAQNDALTWHVFGQATLGHSGGLTRNDRVGAGVDLRFAENWRFEGQISDGTLGLGARAIFNYASEGGNTAYFGYALDPGREFNSITLAGRDQGQFVAGAKRAIGTDVSVFGENTYDIFGQHRSLTSAYGVEYAPSDVLTWSSALELGRIDDPTGDFDRAALSFGVRYQDEAGLSARARLELRQDRGIISGTNRDADTILFAANARYKIDDNQRLLFDVDIADTKTDGSSVLSGEYAEATIGYAFRPVEHDRLNVLAKYTYLRDMYGQLIDGTSQPGPRQESHVFSIDASYDLNQQWTLGGKVGARFSDSAPDSTTPLARNDAFLAVLNTRYHVTHKWDLLLEGRYLVADQAGFEEIGVLGAAYRHMGNNVKLGVGYNFGSFSDDLTDLTYDDKGVFVNLVAKF